MEASRSGRTHPAESSDPKVARVIDAGRALGIEVRPVTFDAETRTAQDAAAAIGCNVAQIVKSLVFRSDDGPALLLVSGANRVDVTKAARALGKDKLERCDAEGARAATGYSIGATPPFGLASEVPMLIDEDLLTHDEVWAAAGRTDSVFPLDPHDLARASGAPVIELAG